LLFIITYFLKMARENGKFWLEQAQVNSGK